MRLFLEINYLHSRNQAISPLFMSLHFFSFLPRFSLALGFFFKFLSCSFSYLNDVADTSYIDTRSFLLTFFSCFIFFSFCSFLRIPGCISYLLTLSDGAEGKEKQYSSTIGKCVLSFLSTVFNRRSEWQISGWTEGSRAASIRPR